MIQACEKEKRITRNQRVSKIHVHFPAYSTSNNMFNNCSEFDFKL